MSAPSVDQAVASAIRTRRSVRGFLPEPVPEATVRELLDLARTAPSMTNTQPWRVRVLTGAALAGLVGEAVAAHERGESWEAEYAYYPERWEDPYRERRRTLGWALYGLLGIARGDRDASARQHRRNFAFFGAPVGMIVTTGRVLQTGSYLDLGMFLQTIMVAARGAGLDTCPQAAWAFMHPVVRRVLAIPDDEVIVCGMALGFCDKAAPANSLVPAREPVQAFASFQDGSQSTK